MDADNRVVLNCGGIRHEVYKVDNGKLMASIVTDADPFGPKYSNVLIITEF